jgi:hypothetical protein
MNKISIKLLIAGNLKFNLNISKISKWKSFLFSISEAHHLGIIPNSDGLDWEYTDAKLSEILIPDQAYDLTFAIGNFPLENNFYMRRISNNVAILSLFETGDILRNSDLKIENFIIRNIYEIVLVYLKFNKQVPESAYTVAHDEIRGCIFDINSYKPDIVYSTEKVKLCSECRIQFEKLTLPHDFMRKLDRELCRIKKGKFYIIANWIKANPILSILITTLSALIIDVLSHYIWELIKCN